MKLKKKKKGFTLIELMLALGIVTLSATALYKFLALQTENKRAENAGIQFSEIGKSLGNYITRESNNLGSCLVAGGAAIEMPLSVLTKSTGTTSAGSCSLSNRQLLPTVTSSTNIFGVGYKLYIKKNSDGAINGLVLSDSPIKDPKSQTSSPPRYDWLGIAMRAAGPHSGMTFEATGANSLRGLGGGWALSNVDFNGINSLGLLGYRVSYQGNNDDIYLRLDGAYPMRGNLNMGNFNINNATDINFNGWLNGNNALLNNIKSGYISNAGSIVTDSLQSEKAITMSDLHNAEKPGNSVPLNGSGTWDGTKAYIHTWNLYANGTIATGEAGTINAFMDKSGLIGAKNIYIDNTTMRGDDNVKVKGYLTDRLPVYVNKGTKVVNNNDRVDKHSCTAAGGMSKSRIVITPQIMNTYGDFNVKVEVSATPDNRIHTKTYRSEYTSDQIRVYAIDMGSYWTTKIESYVGGMRGTAIQGWQALATVYCDFS